MFVTYSSLQCRAVDGPWELEVSDVSGDSGDSDVSGVSDVNGVSAVSGNV